MYRREILAGLMAAPLLGGLPALAQGRNAKPLGLQMFTALRLLEKDFDGTLALIASLGFKEVETMGSFGRDPAYVRGMLDKHGLVSPSQHLMPGDFYSIWSVPPADAAAQANINRHFQDAFSFDQVDVFIRQAIGRAKVQGQKYIVWQVRWWPGFGMAEARKLAAAFNRAGDLCAEQGLQFCFHNHNEEFAPIDGVIPYFWMVENSNPQTVKLEIDFMWATRAGADPIDMFRRYPGRFRQCHLKDRTAAGDITGTGEGVENFPQLIAAAKAAGVEHFYFEYDRPTAPEAEMRQAAAYLKPILAG